MKKPLSPEPRRAYCNRELHIAANREFVTAKLEQLITTSIILGGNSLVDQ
jgi:hypothetical protein